LLAELQGRLPIRVELQPLGEADFLKILTEPEFNLIRQQVELLRMDGVELNFHPEAIQEIARTTYLANQLLENIGAR
jgi:ATP-dependent HslUV protease ATP-binding subunit HslU